MTQEELDQLPVGTVVYGVAYADVHSSVNEFVVRKDLSNGSHYAYLHLVWWTALVEDCHRTEAEAWTVIEQRLVRLRAELNTKLDEVRNHLFQLRINHEAQEIVG